VVNVPGIGSVDLRPALAALVKAPAGPLLQVSGVTAQITGRCEAGTPALVGSSSVASLSVLGVKLAATEPVERSIDVLDSQSIDPSKIDISKVLAPTADLSALQAALKPVLDALPTISLPAVAARVTVTHGAEIRSGDRLTRRVLEVAITLAGRPVLDAVVGEATVDATGVSCGSLAAAALGLGCTTRRLTLIDVVQHGIRARYEARIGSEHALDLKLDRRMIVASVRKAGKRRITISGRVTRPFAVPRRSISVMRRVSFGSLRVVAHVMPDAHGRFKVTLASPRADRVDTFRFHTRVLYSPSYRHLYDTYTLPQYVVGA
jgi:hypothetical protein